jgi:hypothetical protein
MREWVHARRDLRTVIRRLSDIDIDVLEQLVASSIDAVRERHP